jgi:hypothetical protein
MKNTLRSSPKQKVYPSSKKMAVDRSINQQLAGLAQQFLSAYHSSLATQNVPQLSSLYGHDSVFCLDGQTAQGAEISSQVIAPRLAPGPIRVKVSKTDVQQAKGTGQVLIFVTGEADARPVSEQLHGELHTKVHHFHHIPCICDNGSCLFDKSKHRKSKHRKSSKRPFFS